MPLNSVRVLLVDDNESFVLRASTWVLGEPTLTLVGTARSAREAIEATRALVPNLVLMDAGVPSTNGFDATRKVKALAGAPAVVMMTFHDTEAAREEAERAGADGFLCKAEFAEAMPALLARLFGSPYGRQDRGLPEPSAHALAGSAAESRISSRAAGKGNPTPDATTSKRPVGRAGRGAAGEDHGR